MPKFDTRLEDDGDVAFYLNDCFQASWAQKAEIPHPLSPGMKQLLEIAYNEGKAARSAEIMRLLNNAPYRNL